MAPAARVSVEDAVAVIEEYIENFREGKYPKWSSDVWEKISNALNNKWSATNIYTNVTQNRRNIMSIACTNVGIKFIPFMSKKKIEIYDTSDNSTNENNSDDADETYELEHEAKNLDKFEVKLTCNEWKTIQSSDVKYNDGRNYSILRRGVWTDILALAIFRDTELPCAFQFKNMKIYNRPESLHYLRVKGYCKSESCKNLIFCYLHEKPLDETNVILTIRTRETFYNQHEEVKRQLRGEKRQRVGKEVYYEGAANWLKREALENIKSRGRIPPHVPSKEVITQAKKEYVDAKLDIKPLDGKDLIKAIENMNHVMPYQGSIHEVKRKKLFISFSTPAQILAYKKYCKMTKSISSVSIDGTGSIAKPLVHEDGSSSGHIFLYSMTINFKNETLSVYDMFTESQDTDVIWWWLKQWLKLAPIPKQAVCDCSRAVMNGISLAFNNQTVKTYVETCFLYAIGDEEYSRREPIHTYLRLDVPHFMNSIRIWTCFKFMRMASVRQFYMYCIALLIDCQTIDKFEKIFQLMCIVGLNEFQDSVIQKTNYSVLEARKNLEELIKNRNLDANLEDSINVETKSEVDVKKIENDEETPDDENNCKSENETKKCSRIKNFINNLRDDALFANFIGVELNPFYFPDFIDQFIKLKAYEFPLWTAVAIPYIAEHALTTFVEGHFNIVKHRVLKNHLLPLRLDKLLKLILNYYLGNAAVLTSHLKAFNQNDGPFPSPPSKGNKFTVNLPSQDINTGQSIKKQCDFIQADSKNTDDNKENINVRNLEENNNNNKIPTKKDELKNFVIINDDSRKKANKAGDNTKFENSTIMKVQDNNLSDQKQKLELRKPKGKYFKINPQIEQQNSVTGNVQNLKLLLNGSSVKITISVKGSQYFAINTCGFDSIIQILSSSAMDDPKYMNFIQQSTNKVLQFVKDFTQKPLTSTTYQNRIILLKDLFKNKIENNLGLNQINLYDSVTCIYYKCFASVPSGYVTYICPNCRVYEKPKVILLIDHEVIRRNGYGALEEASHDDWQQKLCYNNSESCSSYCNAKLNIYNTQIFIDLDVRADVNSANPIPGKLSDFPININLGSNQYRLSGVIASEPGHFIPYCRRINNRWDKCNDLNTKVISVRSHTVVLPLGIIYTKVFSKHEDYDEKSNNKQVISQNKVSKLPETISLDDSDITSRDNWRNKEVDDQVYIDASFDFIEDSCFTENETSGNIESDISLNCQFIELLKPGNATPEITVNETIIQLNDTHNFDCIVHIIACAALDNSSYLDFVRNSSNQTLQFVNDFISSKLCQEIYIKRALLLKSLYSLKICTKTCNNVFTYVIDLCESISCTWTTCLKNQASIFNAYTCDFCGYSSYFSPLLKVDAKIITKNGIKALSEAIVYYKFLKKVKCRHRNCSKFCNITAYPNNHLFIDLNIDECNENFKCDLQDFPTVLHLEKEVNKYR